MNIENKVEQALLKEQQKQRRKMLAENRLAAERKKREYWYKYELGDLFIRKFPILHELMERSSKEELAMHLNTVERYLESIAECQKCWRELEDILVEQC